MSVFVVDSNFFIEAHRSTYPLDVAQSFWNKVRQLADTGTIISIDKVRDEIYDHQDTLKLWCENNLPRDFFKDSTAVMTEYAQVAGWAASQSHLYLPKALNEFLDAETADAFLVAYSLADNQNRILVTQEISEPNRRNKIKIPDACLALSVRSCNTIQMFRQLGETF